MCACKRYWLFTQYHSPSLEATGNVYSVPLTNGWDCPIIVQCVGTKGARLGHLRLQAEKGFNMPRSRTSGRGVKRGGPRGGKTPNTVARGSRSGGGVNKLKAARNASRQRRRKIGR